MRRLGALLLCLGVCLGAGGCARVAQIDEQAYAASMSLDITEDDHLRLGVQLLSLGESGGGKGDSGDEGGGPGEGYTLATADGASFAEALDLMQATLQCALNLSQLKTVVISEELARSAAFRPMLREIVLTYQLYGAAQLVVSLTEAKGFIDEQKPVVGMKLANTLTTALEHRQSTGYSPNSSLADVFYAMEAEYGDAVAILAATGGDGGGQPLPEGELGDALPGQLPREGDNKNQYIGAALMGEDGMVGVLTGAQNRCLMLILGELATTSYMMGGKALRLKPSGRPEIEISLEGENPEIRVRLALAAFATDGLPDAGAVADELRADMEELTRYCQSLGADPFGYAERAAGQFATFDDWREYNWRERFPNATVVYAIEVRASAL